MGLWYAVEIVEHNIAVEPNTVSIAMYLCPVLQLTREDNMTIRLQWNEDSGVRVYKFNQPNPKHPGYWDTKTHQDGETQYSVSTAWVPCQFLAGEIFEAKGIANHYYTDGGSWQKKRKKDPALVNARTK
jgi:hypothetical protein